MVEYFFYITVAVTVVAVVFGIVYWVQEKGKAGFKHYGLTPFSRNMVQAGAEI